MWRRKSNGQCDAGLVSTTDQVKGDDGHTTVIAVQIKHSKESSRVRRCLAIGLESDEGQQRAGRDGLEVRETNRELRPYKYCRVPKHEDEEIDRLPSGLPNRS